METVGVMLLETFNYNFYKKYYYNINSLSQKNFLKNSKINITLENYAAQKHCYFGGGGGLNCNHQRPLYSTY